MIKSNKYIRKLSISYVVVRSIGSKREGQRQGIFADSVIPFGPMILVIFRPEMHRTKAWVGIFTKKSRKQVIEISGVL